MINNLVVAFYEKLNLDWNQDCRSVILFITYLSSLIYIITRRNKND